jgi:hypothetical protein
MQGTKDQPGIIPLTISAIFQLLNKAKSKPVGGSKSHSFGGPSSAQRFAQIDDYKMTVSYLEIYNETVNDLLNENNKALDVRTVNNQESFVHGLTEEEVTSEEYIFRWLEKGEVVRKVAETKLNEVSSRSHTIFTIKLELKSGDSEIIKAEINLVDLAGSESVNKTKSEGIRFREGANINKSLLALSNVINELSKSSKKTSSYISYRSSKLTRILQNALSGNSKTCIICTLNQLGSNQCESINTLKFGAKAKTIKTKFSVNKLASKSVIENEFSRYLEGENEKLRQRIKDLEEELRVRIFEPYDSDEDKISEDPEILLKEYYLNQQLNYYESQVSCYIK